MVYYISLLCDVCVPIYIFCSGYGLYSQYRNSSAAYIKKANNKIKRILTHFEIVFILMAAVDIILQRHYFSSFGLQTILKNALLLEHGICGAWWYMQSYVIIVFLSKYVFALFERFNEILLLVISLIFYCVGYLQRVRYVFIHSNNWLVQDIAYMISALFFCQLAFCIGIFFNRHNVISKLRSRLPQTLLFRSQLCVVMLLVLLIAHGIVESYVADVAYGIVAICLYAICKRGNKKILLLQFMGKHSTNIWLTHMLLYQVFAKSIIFVSKNIGITYLTTLALSIAVSYVINLFTWLVKKVLMALTRKETE